MNYWWYMSYVFICTLVRITLSHKGVQSAVDCWRSMRKADAHRHTSHTVGLTGTKLVGYCDIITNDAMPLTLLVLLVNCLVYGSHLMHEAPLCEPWRRLAPNEHHINVICRVHFLHSVLRLTQSRPVVLRWHASNVHTPRTDYELCQLPILSYSM